MKKSAIIFIVLTAFLALLYFGPAKAQGIITTVAGTGVQGYSGDGGAATNATLFFPGGVHVNATGDIFIADELNDVIRKVDGTTGTIYTIAGSNLHGSLVDLGDGGPATNAELADPERAYTDAFGNLFITSGFYSIVREVKASTGIINTIAAWVGEISDACTDTAGNVYISDRYNSIVRKINSTTGITSTIAGTGVSTHSGDGGLAINATLYAPSGLFVDGSCNIFIADEGNNRIRKITAATGIITTIAGNETADYCGDGGPASDACLNHPVAVCADAAGNVYVADKDNNVIRKITEATGIITTIAGNGTAGFSGDGGSSVDASLHMPHGLCVDARGNVFIADNYNNRIRKVTPARTNVDIVEAGQFKFFPNPGNGQFVLQVNDNERTGNVEIYNILGQSLYHLSLKDTITGISLNALPSGIYFLHLRSEGGTRVEKFTINK